MVAILTPYCRSDVTAAAIRVADLCMALGYDIKIIAHDKINNFIHSFWDNKIVSSKNNGIYIHAKGVDKFIYFFTDNTVVDKVNLVTKNAKHILIPTWNQTINKSEVYKVYDAIVLSNNAYYNYFKNYIYSKNTYVCTWESGLPPLNKEGLTADNKIKACFYCDNTVIDYCGSMVLELCSELLRSLFKLEISLISTKSWPRKDRKIINSLISTFKNRFKHESVSNIQKQLACIQQHDWFVYPSVKNDFATAIFRALYCGVPVITNDVLPFNKLITQNINGLLVSCEIKFLATKAPIALPIFGKWYETCHKAFSTNNVLFNMQQQDWQLAKLTRSFDNFWTRLLI